MRHNISPIAMLIAVYIMEVVMRCSCISALFSSAKVEKVVNAPQNPVANINHPCSAIHPPLCAKPKNNPIKKQPTIFTVNVAYGNGLLTYLLMI